MPEQGAAPIARVEPDPPADTLDEGWLDRQHLGAWRSFAALWGRPEDALAIQSACNGMAGTGFACLQESGSWSRIRRLGLPVLLVHRGGGERHVLLRGLEKDRAVVGAPEDSRTVAREEIEQRWLGEYLVAWPQAPDWPVEIRAGHSGPAVEIVMQMAAFAEPAWQGGNAFDAGFEAWLKEFQRRNGLDADGIIGPNTLIHLVAPTISEPRLAVDTAEDE